MKITAAVVREKSKPFTVEELELEEPREDEVLVRLVGTGVCHTDLVVRDQYYPVPLPSVLGHEGAGIVEKVGQKVSKVKPGDHVVLSYMSCGRCVNCREGKLGYCYALFGYNFGGARPDGSTTLSKDGEVIHGSFFGQSSFATYALASERNTVKVRDDVPLNILGPLGCGIQTGAGAVINSLAPHAGSSIAVFGTGSVGLSAIMAARAVGCTTIIGIDIRPGRLEIARELGATHVINGSEGDTVKKIQEITGTGVNYSLETTALPAILRQAVDCLTLTGVCGLIGAAPLGTEVALDMNSILFGRTLRGVIEGDSIPDIFIPQLIELYVQGRFPFDKLIKFYKLEEINDAARDSEAGTVLKPVLTFA
jgi:aryl-alcohol dehydrogenase